MEFTEYFEKVDIYFAETLSEKKEQKVFLSYLFKCAREGHMALIIDEDKITPTPPLELSSLIREGACTIERCILKKDNRYYLERHFECERRFKELLAHMQEMAFNKEEISYGLYDVNGLTFEQAEAVKYAITHPLTLIVGGPGTGKSRTACQIVRNILAQSQKKVAVAAPTGKATANLRNALALSDARCDISTLHALVKRAHLPYDLIVVDEGSMIDAFLMTSLFSSLKKGTHLVLLGDVDQLPPVGSGHFFNDLTLLFPHATKKLTQCHRAELVEILHLAQNIKSKTTFPLEPLPTQKELIATLAQKLFKETTLTSLQELYRRYRLLVPLREGPFGMESLNIKLFEQDKGNFIPIMITVNHSDLELYNGDFGFISRSEKKAYFENSKILPLALLPTYEYSYLLSIHKSQGSEFDEVTILLPEGAERFGKELLYTAVTRAKKKVHVHGTPDILTKIYNNESNRVSIC